MNSTTPLHRFRAENIRDMLRHGLITAVFCCLIAIAMTITGGENWAGHLVYSLAIGMISWLFIDTGRLLLSGASETPVSYTHLTLPTIYSV